MWKRMCLGECWYCRGGMKIDRFQPISDVLSGARVETSQLDGSMRLGPEHPNFLSHLRVFRSMSSCIFSSGSLTLR